MNYDRYFTIAWLITLFFLPGFLHAAELTFEADSALAKRAAKKAEELTQLFDAQFSTKLDYSDDSIDKLDAIVDEIHGSYVAEQPPETALLPVAQGIGSYIGEVYRRNHDAVWGWITEGDQVFPGLKQKSGGYFWPFAKALDRIKTNSEPTISDYYHFLVIR
ncbi:MAG: hypothetical protein AAF387_14765 [Pseudomonadota bacterium]